MPGEEKTAVFRTVGEGVFWTSVSTVIVKIASLATIFLVLRQLGVGEYGVLELVLSITTLLSIFMLPGLESIVVADMGVEKGKGELGYARNILQAFLTLQLLFATVAWSIVFFGAQFFAAFYSVPPHYVQVVSFLFLIAPVRATYSILFRVNLQFFLQSILTVVEEGFKLLVLCVLFFTTELGVFKLLFVIFGSQCAALIVLSPQFIRAWRSLKGGEHTPVPWWSLIRGHGKWGILSTYMGNLGKSIRLWLIQRLLGTEAVGIYAVAIGLIGHTIALAPISAVITPMLPQFAQDRARFTKLLNKAIQYQFFAYVAIGILAFIFFPPILGRIFPEYREAFPLFQVLLLILVPNSAISLINPVFSAFKLQKSLFVSMTIKTLMTIVFTYVGISLFGIWGVAYESIVTGVLQTIERAWSLRRHVPGIVINPLRMLTFDEDDRLLLGKVRGFLQRSIPFARSR